MSLKPIAAVVDDFALALLPALDQELGKQGALVMRCFAGLPNPHLLGRLTDYQGVAVIGGRNPVELVGRLEATSAAAAVPIVGVLPPGSSGTRELRLAGVVDLLAVGVAAAAAAQRVVLMARVPVVRSGARPPAAREAAAPRAPLSGVARPPAGPAAGQPAPHCDAAGAGEQKILGIASSTGGIWVLAELLRSLPRDARLAVVVAQHMEGDFVDFFADWLGATSGWPTVTVREPKPLEAGHAYVPAGNLDLCVEAFKVTAAPPRSRYVPSADRLLETLGHSHGRQSIGVVLSGMGGDGAAGLAELARSGGRALCQLPATAVVSSMPETALRTVPGARAVAPPELPAAVLEG